MKLNKNKIFKSIELIFFKKEKNKYLSRKDDSHDSLL